MKIKGRVVTSFLVFIINILYMSQYYLRDGYISWIEYIGLPIMLALAWWFGKQYDIAKFYAENDALTGMYNRRFVQTILSKIVTSAERNGQMFALLLLDVNDFKLLNDLYGHQAGDNYLQGLAIELRKSVRKTDFVARWGGDEFLILFPDIQNKENLIQMIERIYENIKGVSPNNIEIGVSIGSALYPHDGTDFDDLLRIADKNMYNCKLKKSQSNYSQLENSLLK